MIFNKSGRLMRRNFHINGTHLENVRSYKYLGFLITPSGEVKSGLQDLRDRALKAFMKLKTIMGNTFRQDIITTLELIDSLIKPILLYMSDFWGCLKLPKANPIENLHMMICKQLLGVQKQTTNIGVLLELGRVSLCTYAVKLAIKNWERIKQGKANVLLMASYREAMEENLTWISTIKDSLEVNGMSGLFLNNYENKPPFIHKKIFQTLSDQFHQTAFETIRKDESKLRTYALFKNEIGFETYLRNVKNPAVRSQVTKFRLSNHSLMIESGRHRKIPKELRFCQFCPNKVETEAHFLIHCSAYVKLRDRMFEQVSISNQNFQYYTEEQKIQFLLTNMNTYTVKYIVDSFELRQFLMRMPKMLI